jgi:hypothetical protein
MIGRQYDPYPATGGYTVVVIDRWYHLAATYDYDSDTLQFYCNGVPEGRSRVEKQVINSTKPLTVAGLPDQKHERFTGYIADLFLLSHAESQEGIRNLMSGSYFGDPDARIGWWRIDDESNPGGKVLDREHISWTYNESPLGTFVLSNDDFGAALDHAKSEGKLAELVFPYVMGTTDPDEVKKLFETLDRAELQERFLRGETLVADVGDPSSIRFVPDPRLADAPQRPAIGLIQKYQLSSFVDPELRPGRTVGIVSLLPGEETSVTIQTYAQTEEKLQETASILDSYDTQVRSALDTSLKDEESLRTTAGRDRSVKLDSEVKAPAYGGTASIGAGFQIGRHMARDEYTDLLLNAVSQHVSAASSKRDMKVEYFRGADSSAGAESAQVRRFSNANATRVLDLTLRQMNELFVVLVHLTDLRVCYQDGENRVEVPLNEAQNLVLQVVKHDFQDYVLKAIAEQVDQLIATQNQKGGDETSGFVQKEDRSQTIDRQFTSRYTNTEFGSVANVPGVLVGSKVMLMRTDMVKVEPEMGSVILLEEEQIRSTMLRNDLLTLEVKKLAWILKALASNDADSKKVAADILANERPDVTIAALDVVRTRSHSNSSAAKTSDA